MSMKFRRSMKIAPGVKLNLNKNSASVTVGGKLGRVTKSTNGTTTVGTSIPGTGIYFSEKMSKPASSASPQKSVSKKDWDIKSYDDLLGSDMLDSLSDADFFEYSTQALNFINKSIRPDMPQIEGAYCHTYMQLLNEKRELRQMITQRNRVVRKSPRNDTNATDQPRPSPSYVPAWIFVVLACAALLVEIVAIVSNLLPSAEALQAILPAQAVFIGMGAAIVFGILAGVFANHAE